MFDFNHADGTCHLAPHTRLKNWRFHEVRATTVLVLGHVINIIEHRFRDVMLRLIIRYTNRVD